MRKAQPTNVTTNHTFTASGLLCSTYESQTEDKIRFIDLINNRNLRKPLLASILLHFTQQLSGINAVSYLFKI